MDRFGGQYVPKRNEGVKVVVVTDYDGSSKNVIGNLAYMNEYFHNAIKAGFEIRGQEFSKLKSFKSLVRHLNQTSLDWKTGTKYNLKERR